MPDNVTPIKVIIKGEDGAGDQVFEAETQEGLVEKLKIAQENATRKIREQAQQLEEVQTAAIPQQTPAAPAGFDRQSYFNTLYADPLAAHKLALEQLFGAPVEQVVERFGYVSQAADIAVETAVNNAFSSRHPEFWGNSSEENDTNGKAIAKILTENSWAYTLPNLEAAYAVARQQNKLKFADNNAAPAAPDIPAAPTVLTRPSAGGASVDENEVMAKMTSSQLREYLEKKHANARP